VGNPLRINRLCSMTTCHGRKRGFTIMMNDMGDERQYMNFRCIARPSRHRPAFRASGEDLLLPTRHQLNLTFNKIAGYANKNVNVFMAGISFDTGHPISKYKEDWTT